MFFVVENSKNFDIQIFKQKQKERKFKKNKFKKFLTFLNVYANFYLINIIREYEIIMNLSVLIKELKYKYTFFIILFYIY